MFSCNGPTEICSPVTVAFFNVENLFDTIDAPGKRDGDFTPVGSKKWTSVRYYAKLDSLGKVIAALGDQNFPGLVGLCEIENRQVIEDLIHCDFLKKGKYSLVHFDSPDARGIDNALLYRPGFFKVIEAEPIQVVFPENHYPTRDILYVKGSLSNNDVLHVFVNHWTSRMAGVEKSEPRRMHIASLLREKVDEIFIADPSAKIIIMGDLNDEPDNRSLAEILRAGMPGEATRHDTLFNMVMPLNLVGEGSYNYQGEWNMLDHMIVSGALLNENSGWQISGDADVFDPLWIVYQGRNYSSPSKTYSGSKYYGGFSDHFPVRIKLERK